MHKTTLLVTFIATSFAPGFIISMDYSLDSNGFFLDPIAKAATDQAAADISAAITSSLSVVNQQNVDVGSGGDRIIINGSNQFQNPSTGVTQTRDYATNPVAADTFVVYVGSRLLSGSTLGQGGFSSNVSASFFSGLTQTTLDSAMISYNSTFGRGAGPTMTSFNITPNGLSTTVSNGPTLGHLWFDHDTDNDNDIDTTAELGLSWHLDHTTPVAAGKSDLYSVALHEILHAIGYGDSLSWSNIIGGTTYFGAEGVAENGGSGANLVDPGGDHLAPSVMSTSIIDGSPQEVAMDPNITTGTRKYLTDLDLAIPARYRLHHHLRHHRPRAFFCSFRHLRPSTRRQPPQKLIRLLESLPPQKKSLSRVSRKGILTY